MRRRSFLRAGTRGMVDGAGKNCLWEGLKRWEFRRMVKSATEFRLRKALSFLGVTTLKNGGATFKASRHRSIHTMSEGITGRALPTKIREYQRFSLKCENG